MVGHGIVEFSADGKRALGPGELICFDLKSESGPATLNRVACFLGTSRLTCRRSVLDRLLPIPEALVIEADEYLFTLGGAITEVAVLDEPLCYYRLHGHNLYQFSDDDPARLATLAHACRAQLNAAEAVLDRVADSARAEAMQFARRPEPLLALVDQVRQLSRR